jgi:type VI secretion system protein ImpF
MARPRTDHGLLPSLIDRLSDPESAVPGRSSGYSHEQVMDAVRRDLEALFNTHDPSTFVPAGYPEVHASIVAYGLPDFPSLSSVATFRREDIGLLIEEAIARFEPRLRDVRVLFADPSGDAAQYQIRFHIEALLNVDPSPEVEFETILELSTGQASIRPGTP